MRRTSSSSSPSAAIAGTIGAVLGGRGVLVPTVVIELLLGVVIGPQVLGLETSEFLEFFSNLGLGLLFFFAGYEIDVRRIAGAPLRLAAVGWALSLVLAYAIGGVLAATGVVLSLLFTGSALATTAIGTLIPVLSDSGQLRSRFGTYLLAGGAVGEFGPILLLTLFLSAQSTLHNAIILVAFVALAVGVAVLAVRSSGRTVPLLERTIEKSSQLAVRWIVVLVFALAALASELGLDLLLGGFAAGVITRQVLRGREVPTFDARLTAVAFGVFVPFFFVVSGMQLDVDALFSSVGVRREDAAVLRALPGRPRRPGAGALPPRARRDAARVSLAFFLSTQLPLVLAITTLAQDGGHMTDVDRSVAGRRRRAVHALLPDPGPAAQRRRRGPPERRRAGARGRRCPPDRGMTGTHPAPPRRHPVIAPTRLFRARIWLASAMWVPVLAANLAAIALALFLPVLDRRFDDGGRLPVSVGAAQEIFGALAAGMIAFAGITFSGVFVAAQIQTSSYSPRLAARLRRDPVIIAGLALPTATATYALFALAAIGRDAVARGNRHRRPRPADRDAVRVRRTRSARVRPDPDRRHPPERHATRQRGDRGRPPGRRRAPRRGAASSPRTGARRPSPTTGGRAWSRRSIARRCSGSHERRAASWRCFRASGSTSRPG